jgi:hypothetical protein
MDREQIQKAINELKAESRTIQSRVLRGYLLSNECEIVGGRPGETYRCCDAIYIPLGKLTVTRVLSAVNEIRKQVPEATEFNIGHSFRLYDSFREMMEGSQHYDPQAHYHSVELTA